MAKFQLLPNGFVRRGTDNAVIPQDPGNLDWQDFLAWQAGGNTPDPLPPPLPVSIDVVAELLALRDRVAILEQRLPGTPR